MKKRTARADEVLALLNVTQIDWFGHVRGFLHRYYDAREGYELSSGGRFRSVKCAEIDGVFCEPKKKMLFVYDFGDEWRFIVQAKGRALPVDGVRCPVVIESYSDNPEQYPEDEPGPPAPEPVVTAGDLDRQAAGAWQKKKVQESARHRRYLEPEDRSQKKIDAWLT